MSCLEHACSEIEKGAGKEFGSWEGREGAGRGLRPGGGAKAGGWRGRASPEGSAICGTRGAGSAPGAASGRRAWAPSRQKHKVRPQCMRIVRK